jgi:hypothetical protein
MWMTALNALYESKMALLQSEIDEMELDKYQADMPRGNAGRMYNPTPDLPPVAFGSIVSLAEKQKQAVQAAEAEQQALIELDDIGRQV